MKAGLLAPLYLSVSWVLTVSYQLFTDTAVKSIATNVSVLSPGTSIWLNANIQTLVFIYAFTWIFVLSSVIPSAILGKERSVLSQYVVVLLLSMLAFFMPDILLSVGGIEISQILNATVFLQNPLLAGVYLVAPYLFMIGLDVHCRRARRNTKQRDLIDEYTKLQSQNYNSMNYVAENTLQDQNSKA
jgi:hypothetical protein